MRIVPYRTREKLLNNLFNLEGEQSDLSTGGYPLPQSNTISILVVDDEPSVLDTFRLFLEREPGFVVEILPSGTEALDLLDTRYFDVIVADYSMPEITGLALLREARARGCQSLFVIVTGKRLAHIAIDALNSGADFYVQKGADTAKDIGLLIDFIKTRVPKKNAEHDIIEWERFYHSVVESSPDIICRMLPDGSFTYTNESCMHFFGKQYHDMIHQNLFSLIPADEKTAVLAQLQNLSAVKPDVLLEHHIQTDGGRTPLLQWYYHGFFSAHGAVSDYQVAGRTVEGLVRIGEKGSAKAPFVPAAAPAPSSASLKSDDYDWKGLVDTIQSLENPVFAIDQSGKVIAWNKAIEELTGVEASRMVGRGQQEYAVPFYGKQAPMLIDHIFLPPGSPAAANLPGIKKVGDTYIGEMERVQIKGKPMLLWGKGSPVYDVKGALIAAIEVITVGEPQAGADAGGMEKYLGGISSITIKVSGEGVGGAIAGAIGSSTGGYGVYATDQRVFIIRNPDLDAEKAHGVQFGTFIMDELFGMTVDTHQRSIRELEKLKVFEAWKKDIVSINLKKPVLLSGYLTIVVDKAGSFRVYIDHKKSYAHIEQLMQAFCPDKIKIE
jgi:PAS domain S-box-containing protein